MKKFYPQSHYIWYMLLLIVMFSLLGIFGGIFYKPEMFGMLIFSVILIGLGFLFFLNRIYIGNDEIRIACVAHKGTYQLADLKEIFFYMTAGGRYNPPTLWMIFCFFDFSNAPSNISIHKFFKHCKANSNIKLARFELRRKLLTEILSKNKDIKFTGPNVDDALTKLAKQTQKHNNEPVM